MRIHIYIYIYTYYVYIPQVASRPALKAVEDYLLDSPSNVRSELQWLQSAGRRNPSRETLSIAHYEYLALAEKTSVLREAVFCFFEPA